MEAGVVSAAEMMARPRPVRRPRTTRTKQEVREIERAIDLAIAREGVAALEELARKSEKNILPQKMADVVIPMRAHRVLTAEQRAARNARARQRRAERKVAAFQMAAGLPNPYAVPMLRGHGGKARHRKSLAGLTPEQAKCAGVIEAGGQFRVVRKKHMRGGRSVAQMYNSYDLLLRRHGPAVAEKYAAKHGLDVSGRRILGLPV